MDEQLQTLQHVKRTLLDVAIAFGPKLLVAIVIITAGVFVGRWISNALAGTLRKIELEPPVRELLLRVVRILVLLLFGIMALQNLGVELLPLIAGLGVVGAGIALAMQGVLSNAVAGLTIIFTRPFRVGEHVALLGVEGRIESITLFSTVLGHADLSRVVIPNRKIVGEVLHNYGTIRQMEIVVGVSYNTDLNDALRASSEALHGNPRVLRDPAPVVAIRMLAESSIDIALKPWVKVPDYGAALTEINKTIVETFRARAIAIPFPQREVRMLAEVVQKPGLHAA
jgi:small conductance mechanosensitive channel